MAEVEGQEVLVVDRDENVRRGIQALLTEAGIVPTLLGDVERAQGLVREKYFAAAIIDLDTPRENGALELLRWMHTEAPGTTLIVLTARREFDAAVAAFRAGAADVIVKSPSEIEYLGRRVREACALVKTSADNARLLGDALLLHDEILKRMMETSRRVQELEERLGGGAQSADADEISTLLVVESHDDHWLSDELERGLAHRPGYRLHRALTGGEALDVGAARRFHIALVRDNLPDLPGSMIVNTLRAQSPETITILFSRPIPGQRPGKVQVIEGSRAIPLVPELTEAGQLIARLDELRDAFVAKSRERRYLAAFRQNNYELLRRYADLKQKLKRAAD